MLGVTDYLWRLLPANPILLRVVETAGKKRRDLFIRCGYLALLILVMFVSLAGGAGASNLSALSVFSRQTFRNMSYLQLALVALLAPIFTAGAITQEKDSQTYDILLTTPLTNAQIILGSLLSRLFFVIALLISGIPIFSVTQIFGGVAIKSIVMSFAIAAATAFVTGALAMAIATFKVGTRRTIFSFYLFIVIYLVGIGLLDQLPYFQITGPHTSTTASHISWFTGIHPFLALRVVLGDPTYRPPDMAILPAQFNVWPINWYLTNPANFFVSLMFSLTFILIIPSIVLLRRMAQATLSFKSWLLQKVKLSSGDRTRKPRIVWSNPIAWREAKTKASAARASVLRYSFMGAGLIGALVLVIMYASYAERPAKYLAAGSYDTKFNTITIRGENQTYGVPNSMTIMLNGQPAARDVLNGYFKVESYTTNKTSRGTKDVTSLVLSSVKRQLDDATARQFLLGASILEFAVILLIVTNAAASTVTREKEDGSLDLLLTTPITSRYYIWGKLRGLVSFVIPLLAVPVLSSAFFIVYDAFRLLTSSDTSNFRWIVFPEAVLVLPGTLVIVAAFASILGMQMSLRCRTTVRAVMSSVGIILGACGLLGFCGYSILSSRGSGDSDISLVISSFSPFTVMMLMIDPQQLAPHAFGNAGGDEIISRRIIIFVTSWVAIAGYAVAVWSMYKSMVKNFDMTIRRQSR